MKKIIAIIMICSIALGCVACASDKSESTVDETYEIMANFTEVEDNGDIKVAVQDLGGVYTELYDKDGLIVKLVKGDDEIYDNNGNKIKSSSLVCGDSVKITYDGELAKDSPKTIKAYKIIKIG